MAAAERLVSQRLPDRTTAARRLISTAPSHGIDLSLVFVTTEPTAHGTAVRQACLIVPGAGRTAMVFISEPPPGGDPDGLEAAAQERAACISMACEHLGHARRGEVAIAQALPEPRDAWALSACAASGFTRVGTLIYLRRPLGSDTGLLKSDAPAPSGLSIRPLGEVPIEDRDRLMIDVLEQSYQGTLDCPELCGLRETKDILASHQATGEFDPSTWWIVFEGSTARGCVLLTRCPEQHSLELVYLGLSPHLRGKGAARWAMSQGVRASRKHASGWSLTCAVDERNTPARALYRSMGFEPFGERVALVRPLETPVRGT